MTINPARYRATREASFEDINLDQETVIVSGRRYTEADAAADAAQVEAQTRGPSRGGHSLSGDGTHLPKVATVLPRDIRDKARKHA
jgi:hypothetical protein